MGLNVETVLLSQKKEIKQSNFYESREYGLDLLRIVSMFMIVLLHFASHGHLLEVFSPYTPMHYVEYAIRSICICSVNVFVMISGYFSISKKSAININRLFSLYIAVLFYSIIGLIVSSLFLNNITPIDIVSAIFPFSYHSYWFFTSYACLVLVTPFLNTAIEKLDRRSYLYLLFVFAIMVSIIGDILPKTYLFDVSDGKQFIWFVFLYLFAGYIRLYGARIDRWNTISKVVLFFVLAGLMLFLYFALNLLANSGFTFITSYGLTSAFSRYRSFLVLAESYVIFSLFKNLKIKNRNTIKLITFASPLMFGVYLIHDNENFREILFSNILRTSDISNSILGLSVSLGFAVCVFLICIIVEHIRMMAFKLIKADKLIDRIAKKITLAANNIIDIIQR